MDLLVRNFAKDKAVQQQKVLHARVDCAREEEAKAIVETLEAKEETPVMEELTEHLATSSVSVYGVKQKGVPNVMTISVLKVLTLTSHGVRDGAPCDKKCNAQGCKRSQGANCIQGKCKRGPFKKG